MCSAKERILSNLFPVVEIPEFVFSAETRFQSDSELAEVCDAAGPLPLLLKGPRLYTVEQPSRGSVFSLTTSGGESAIRREDFTQWFSRNDRAGWAVELLNVLFRHHAWKRGLRWDRITDQYHFPRTKPKSVWWEIGKQTISREVTAPHMGWIEIENQVRAEVQYGWRHQSVRAEFVPVQGNLLLASGTQLAANRIGREDSRDNAAGRANIFRLTAAGKERASLALIEVLVDRAGQGPS